jgi:hypothetical protein
MRKYKDKPRINAYKDENNVICYIFDEIFRKRFFSQTKKLADGCLIWTGICNTKYGLNYGRFSFVTEYGFCNKLAHRIAYEMEHNVYLDSKTFVLHKCDVPECVNPEHLYIGDGVDNMQDCIKRGRFCGGNVKLYDEEVEEIRRLYKTGKVTQEFLGKMFRISQVGISKIILTQTRTQKLYPYGCSIHVQN